jgi:hypothetical protein
MKEHLLFFSSEFSYHNNSSATFTVRLPYEIKLDGEWKCAILDFFASSDHSGIHSSEFIYILGDFCGISFISQTDQRPILKKIHLSGGTKFYEFANPIYIPVKQKRLSEFDLTFLDSDLNPIDLKRPNKFECTLHFIQNE